jgi:hypothetical protein
MSTIEKNISNFIESQFPEIYRDEGPLFVEFVKKYYEWMESSNNAMYHSRRILDYKDIDDTVDEFVVKFKQKYLSDIQLDTVAQTRQLVKKSLDLYRSKGTDRSVDLFFRAVFGKPAEVYYPGEDIFRLSDGAWVKPKYLEVSPSDYNIQFVGKQVQGVNSGATAFVERYIRRKVKKKYINVLYISAIAGNFETGELLTLFGQSLKGIPTIIGSTTTLDIIVGGADFKVGDIVSLTSNSGLQGKARVSQISDVVGVVDFNLLESGWGYTANAQVLISEKVLTVENVRTSSNTTNIQFDVFETIKQPLANVVYINANNTFTPNVGDNLYTYYTNNTVAGMGVVVSAAANGSTNGEVYVSEKIRTLGPVVEPNANLSGTVLITSSLGTLSGKSTFSAGGNTVTGNGTAFDVQLKIGTIIEFFEYATGGILTGTETKRVTAITNATSITVDSAFENTPDYAIMQVISNRIIQGTGTSFNTDFVYGNSVAIYTNSTSYFLRTVNAVINATFMTIQEGITTSNTAATYANTKSNNFIYSQSNAIVANIQSRTDRTISANVIGVGANLTLHYANSSGSISNGQYLYQVDAEDNEIANARIISIISNNGANGVLVVNDAIGVFQREAGYPLRVRNANGSANSVTANLTSLDLYLGVINVVGSFITSNNNSIYGLDTLSNGFVSRVSSGVFASFQISNTMQFSESITISSEPIRPYANLSLESPEFGFPKYPSANLTTEFLEDIFDQKAYSIGGISALTAINPGKNYDYPPFVTIYEPVTAGFARKDYIFEIANTTGIFSSGEIIEQDNGSLGQVRFANDTTIIVKRLEFENTFDTNLAITGVSTGFVANLVSVSERDNIETIGLNAFVSSNVQTGIGSVRALEIVDSGFGYSNGELATFISTDKTRTGTAKIYLGKQGASEGYYRNRNGFISDAKYIFDGEYYQDYSYEVRTAVTSDKYAEMLKNVLHVAGTKTFYAVVLAETANTSTNIITNITEE